MATWRRRPPQGQTVAHSDHGSVYTSWLFGNRLRHAGILGRGQSDGRGHPDDGVTRLHPDRADTGPNAVGHPPRARLVLEYLMPIHGLLVPPANLSADEPVCSTILFDWSLAYTFAMLLLNARLWR